ncbi:MAG: nitrogenase component 1 [Polyangia bacterium]|jgi:nitrogenase molybdenum-iron protein alpha/beta subunit|nr:nitrogenase component 1 [Polyangia bacterium]
MPTDGIDKVEAHPHLGSKEQAQRIAARLDQVMCTLEGMATLFAQTPGDFAVVVHGDRDCLGVVVQGMAYPGTERFFGTQLGEPDAVAGHGATRLGECLRAICQHVRPRVVFVIGTCLSALLGEDLEPVARQLGRETGVRVVALEGAGMGFVSQAEILDRHACLLLDSVEDSKREAPRPSGQLCAVGFDPGPEVRRLMSVIGAPLSAALHVGAPLSDWARLPSARGHLLLDEALYPQLASALRERRGQETIEAPFPVGCGGTRGFFDSLIQRCGLNSDEAGAIIGPEEGPALEAVEVARRRLAGLRIGFNLGSKKNLDSRTLARAGLVDLQVFEELGFEPVLLVQGDDSPSRMDALEGILGGYGCGAPVRVFSDTVFFGALCRAEGCELVYASDHLREEAEAAGIPFLPIGVLEPGWGRVRANIGRILSALGEAQ